MNKICRICSWYTKNINNSFLTCYLNIKCAQLELNIFQLFQVSKQKIYRLAFKFWLRSKLDWSCGLRALNVWAATSSRFPETSKTDPTLSSMLLTILWSRYFCFKTIVRNTTLRYTLSFWKDSDLFFHHFQNWKLDTSQCFKWTWKYFTGFLPFLKTIEIIQKFS